MQLKLITVPFDAETGGFPVDPLRGIEGEIVSVVEHFFTHAGLPHLLLVVHHRPPRDLRAAPQISQPNERPVEIAARLQLTEPERELFDRLRAWRNARAQAEGVPPYVLLTNRQVAEIAKCRPQSLTGLREVDGIGEAKAQKFGRDLLTLVSSLSPLSPISPPGNAQDAVPA